MEGEAYEYLVLAGVSFVWIIFSDAANFTWAEVVVGNFTKQSSL